MSHFLSKGKKIDSPSIVDRENSGMDRIMQIDLVVSRALSLFQLLQRFWMWQKKKSKSILSYGGRTSQGNLCTVPPPPVDPVVSACVFIYSCVRSFVHSFKFIWPPTPTSDSRQGTVLHVEKDSSTSQSVLWDHGFESCHSE